MTPYLGTSIKDLLASERAMQIINSALSSGRPPLVKLARIEAVVAMWLDDPMTLVNGGEPA